MNFFTNIVISVAVSLGILLGYQKVILPKEVQKIYVVDTEKIIKIQKKIILDDYGDNTGNALKVIAKQTEKMMKIMNAIAKRDNAIIVTKKAVVTGNAKDITKLVLRAME
jgi:hypothetical protein